MEAEYAEYKTAWIEEAVGQARNTVEKGTFFAHKLFRQWRGLDEDTEIEDLHHCDGAYDGGIDLAYLERTEDEAAGSTWYLIQSKYGTALSGPDTIMAEGHKILTTIEGLRSRLNQQSDAVLSSISEFLCSRGPEDRVIIVFLTVDPLTPEEVLALNNVGVLAREKFRSGFEVESISIRTIYDLQGEDRSAGVRISFPGNLSSAGDDLLVGSVSLLGLHGFLSDYKNKTGNLNKIFEKNVRQFLGSRPTNRKMRETIRENPELFGMFNNGITVVVKEWRINDDGSAQLIDPFIVNGCQTANSVWREVENRVNNGSTGTSAETEDWKQRAAKGAVVVKVARTGENGNNLMADITRHTNSQTAVKGKDFMALNQDFQRWQKWFEDKHGVYLEVQAGGWEARKTRQKKNPRIRQITDFTTAQNLLKFYGAAWLKEPGTAYRTAAEFSPGAKVYEEIVNQDGFNERDLYAAWLLYRHATGPEYGYGRRKNGEHKAYTKFLFCYVVMEVLETVLKANSVDLNGRTRTEAMISVLSDDSARKALLDTADKTIKAFFSPVGDCYGEDVAFKERFASNINEYLKWKELVTQSRPFLSQMDFIRKFVMMGAGEEIWRAVREAFQVNKELVAIK